MLFCPVKLIVGVLYPNDVLWSWTKRALANLWGEPEAESDPFLFSSLTDYYHNIAPVLYRRFRSFRGLFDPDRIAEWKHAGIDVERESGVVRRVNVDPGYLNGARIVLASTKDHAHRIYLGMGIFAEVTMRYRRGRWVSFDYTFPDFADGRYDGFLSVVRRQWLDDMAARRLQV